MSDWTMIEFNKCIAALKLNQAEAADLCNVSRKTISEWTNGHAPVPPEALAVMRHAASGAMAEAQKEQAHKHSKEQLASAKARRLAPLLLDASKIPADAVYGNYRWSTAKVGVWHIQAMVDNALMIFIKQPSGETKCYRAAPKSNNITLQSA